MVSNAKSSSVISLDNLSADVVLIGAGPLSFGVLEALRQELGSKSSIILLERNNRFEGSGYASIKHFRTYQTHAALSLAVKETVSWFEKLPAKKGQTVLYRFPYIFIASSKEQLTTFAQNLATVRKLGFGKDAEIIGSRLLVERFPFLHANAHVYGALLYPDAGWINLTLGIKHIIASAKNTIFCLNTAMQKVIVKNNKMHGVQTTKGFIKTDTVVVSPGQFIFDAIDSITGATLAGEEMLRKAIYIQKRQSFEGKISNFPANTKFFLIAENGAYARMATDKNGAGMAMYGFADPTVPHEKNPEVNPKPDGMQFAKSVYKSLAPLMPEYNFGENLAVPPENARAGYYVETKDHLPIISDTNISGLYLCAALSHLGVMTFIGHGKRIVNLMKHNNLQHNPFDIRRNFTAGIGSVL